MSGVGREYGPPHSRRAVAGYWGSIAVHDYPVKRRAGRGPGDVHGIAGDDVGAVPPLLVPAVGLQPPPWTGRRPGGGRDAGVLCPTPGTTDRLRSRPAQGQIPLVPP